MTNEKTTCERKLIVRKMPLLNSVRTIEHLVSEIREEV